MSPTNLAVWDGADLDILLIRAGRAPKIHISRAVRGGQLRQGSEGAASGERLRRRSVHDV